MEKLNYSVCPNQETTNCCFYFRNQKWQKVEDSIESANRMPNSLHGILVIELVYTEMLTGNLFSEDVEWDLKKGVCNWNKFHQIYNAINFAWLTEYLLEEYYLQQAYRRIGSPCMDII